MGFSSDECGHLTARLVQSRTMRRFCASLRFGYSSELINSNSHVAIYQWIKALGEEVAQMKRPSAQIVEIDEMHSYVGHKKTAAGSGLLLIDWGNASSMLSLGPEAS